tara:strand:- start:2267 stop:2890 length:624 start_codon:yes stop_codon:yes gene_type:complete
MSLRLNGSNSGFSEITAPATAGDNTLTLPAGNGSANQYLANGSTAGQLAFVTPPGSFTSYAVICDEKGHDTDGGTFTSGDWRTRDLNTEIIDPDGIVSISSNQFTLGAGNYLIEWSAPGYHVDRHFARLRNITSSSTDGLGTVMYANSTNTVMNRSQGYARVTLTGSTTYEIQHRSQTSQTGNGFGIDTGVSGVNSRYTVVEIYKEA